MVTDFLSQRNVLDIDDEDVGSALLGYSKTDTSTVVYCRAFPSFNVTSRIIVFCYSN